MRRLILLLVIVSVPFLVVAQQEGRHLEGTTPVTHTISDALDTAQVMQVTPTTALDSFTYACTLKTSEDDSGFVDWDSPLQKMILTLGEVTAGVNHLDTATIGVVGCTVVFASTDELGIEYDLSTGADANRTTAVDSIVDIWNNATNLKDSIEAQDSASYIKLVSKYSQLTFGGRWTMQLASGAGAPTDSLDTTSYITTIEMVCDSLVSLINADDTLSSVMTATDSTDSIIFTSDQPGLAYTWIGADSTMDGSGDTATITGNATGWSTGSDSIGWFSMTAPVTFNALQARIILSASSSTSGGYGETDSGFLYLYGEGAGKYNTLEVDSCDALPCTLFVNLPDTGLYADTMYRDMIRMGWKVTDTVSNSTSGPYTHNIVYWFLARP